MNNYNLMFPANAYDELYWAVQNKGDIATIYDNIAFILTDPLYDLTTEQKTHLTELFLAISKNGFVVFSPPKNPFLPLPMAVHNYFWVKPLSTKNYKRMQNPSRFVELVQFYQVEDGDRVWNGADLHWSMSTNVFSDIVHHNDLHDWRKPLSMVERLIKLYTNPGDTVLDPFCGSGVVAEACMRLDRGFICFDNNVELIAKTKERLKID